MKKITSVICTLLLTSFALKAQVKEGSIVNGVNGKPVGIVFQYDADTGSGYMVSLVETALPWGEMGTDIDHVTNYVNSALAGNDFSGLVNTAAIVSILDAKTESAAKWCFELNAGGLTGWYLPSLGELNRLLTKKQLVNQAIEKAGKGAMPIVNAWYWSSSEGDENVSWNVNFSGGDNYPANKTLVRHVRAIRKF